MPKVCAVTGCMDEAIAGLKADTIVMGRGRYLCIGHLKERIERRVVLEPFVRLEGEEMWARGGGRTSR